MTDDAPRPAWPGAPQPQPDPEAQVPQWHAPREPQPTAAPQEEPEAPRPSWNLPAAAARTIDLKLVIAVLIGLVSVTGAVLAWQSALAGEKATDKDRQAIAESVIIAQTTADEELVVQDARTRFADHTAAIVAAGLLDEQSDRFAAAGNDVAARAAADEAVDQRTLARRVLESGNAPVLLQKYVDDPADGSPPVFDERQLRADLRQLSADTNQVDPEETEEDAQELRDKAQRLDGFLIPMVGAIVLLTFAQVSRPRPVRLGLTGLGTAVWIVATVLAFGGG